MRLHIYINGRQRLVADIAAGQVKHTLELVNSKMPDLFLQGRVNVTLDSDSHSNVTYLLNHNDLRLSA